MDRALREFRIRGVATNIAFVDNLLKHPTFLNDTYTTKFIDTTPELFDFKQAAGPGDEDPDLHRRHHGERPSRNRGPPEAAGRGARRRSRPALEGRTRDGHPQPAGAEGPAGRRRLDAAQKKVLVTDTTMRDGHQSLLATRMRSIDMIRVAPAYAANLPQLFSRRMLGRRDLRRGLPLPAGMPVAAAARPARARCRT